MSTTNVTIKVQSTINPKGPNMFHIEYSDPTGKRTILPEQSVSGDSFFISFSGTTGQNYHVEARDILFENQLLITTIHNGTTNATLTTTPKKLHGIGATL